MYRARTVTFQDVYHDSIENTITYLTLCTSYHAEIHGTCRGAWVRPGHATPRHREQVRCACWPEQGHDDTGSRTTEGEHAGDTPRKPRDLVASPPRLLTSKMAVLVSEGEIVVLS